ncbi:hypothetical protein FA10DRAFT_262799 [Acaromyces ingoldii]|uniref:Uncharacterized protein n=1 Tax=Acaromyces ingoldii TaxID=215250 RepID=A0A316YCN1_9BASI|nr:hypothetical protein FA10DRAFT_262799 [Acaromyces ingoldii]PWN87012.1 hypothetical protein FA10DRAFT_262799 [Acaromyces ingoldii]
MLKYLVFLLVFGKVVVCLPSASLQDGQQRLERRARIKRMPAATGVFGYQQAPVTPQHCEPPQSSAHAVPTCSNEISSRLSPPLQITSPPPASPFVARPHFKSLREPSLQGSEDVPRESGTRKLEQNEDETNSNDQSTSWSLNSENNRSSSSESTHSSGSWENTTSHKSSDSTSSLRASEYTTLSEPLEDEAPKKSWSSRRYWWRKKFGIPAPKKTKTYTDEQKKEIQRIRLRLLDIKRRPERFESLWSEYDEWSVQNSFMTIGQRASFNKQLKLIRAVQTVTINLSLKRYRE